MGDRGFESQFTSINLNLGPKLVGKSPYFWSCYVWFYNTIAQTRYSVVISVSVPRHGTKQREVLAFWSIITKLMYVSIRVCGWAKWGFTPGELTCHRNQPTNEPIHGWAVEHLKTYLLPIILRVFFFLIYLVKKNTDK